MKIIRSVQPNHQFSLLSVKQKRLFKIIVSITACTTFLNGTCTEKDKESIALNAYIYGYPLVTMEMTRRVMTNVAKPDFFRAPMGQFAHAREYPKAGFTTVTAPNADTLYSNAWLDLSQEPYILEVPAQKDRYYLVPLLSAWTTVFFVIGTRTTGTQAQIYVIAGPEWERTLPPALSTAPLIKAPTDLIWILGRTYSTGTEEDYKKVHAIQNKYKLTPLSAYGKKRTAKLNRVDPSIDMNSPLREQVNCMNTETFFEELTKSMQVNKPAKEDAPLIARIKRIGLFDRSPSTVLPNTYAHIPQKALQMIMNHQRKSGTLKNGWMITLKAGSYGTDYLQRAYVAAIGLGANLPEDALYPVATTDSGGRTLNGSFSYTIHFASHQLPPVKGFWSLTLYNDSFFFVDNPLNRYTLSPRNDLQYNKDGSLDLLIQHRAPKEEHLSNWLPAPQGNFVLTLRLYWPEQAILDGTWSPPCIQRIKAPNNTMRVGLSSRKVSKTS